MLRLHSVLGWRLAVTLRITTLTSLSGQGVPIRPWAQWTAKTALLAAGFAAAAGGLSGVALAVGGSASSDAGPGLSLGRLAAPAGVCDNAGALPGVVGAACQVGTAVLPAAAPAQNGSGFRERGAGRERPVPAAARPPPEQRGLSRTRLPPQAAERHRARLPLVFPFRGKPRTSRLRTGRVCQRHTRPVCLVITVQAQNVRTGRMIRLRRVAFLLPSALSESLDSSQSPYSAWSVRILRAASRASRDVPRGRYTTR
jgi:hypothetical protein